jgi:hypothetical protein
MCFTAPKSHSALTFMNENNAKETSKECYYITSSSFSSFTSETYCSLTRKKIMEMLTEMDMILFAPSICPSKIISYGYKLF